MTISVSRPRLKFAFKEQEPLVEFDLFEFEDMLEVCDKSAENDPGFDKADFVRSWMQERGLPADMPKAAIWAWLMAYRQKSEEALKNINGP